MINTGARNNSIDMPCTRASKTIGSVLSRSDMIVIGTVKTVRLEQKGNANIRLYYCFNINAVLKGNPSLQEKSENCFYIVPLKVLQRDRCSSIHNPYGPDTSSLGFFTEGQQLLIYIRNNEIVRYRSFVQTVSASLFPQSLSMGEEMVLVENI